MKLTKIQIKNFENMLTELSKAADRCERRYAKHIDNGEMDKALKADRVADKNHHEIYGIIDALLIIGYRVNWSFYPDSDIEYATLEKLSK